MLPPPTRQWPITSLQALLYLGVCARPTLRGFHGAHPKPVHVCSRSTDSKEFTDAFFQTCNSSRGVCRCCAFGLRASLLCVSNRAASAAAGGGRGGVRAWTWLHLGGRILGSSRIAMGVGQRVLGAAALSARCLGAAVLGAVRAVVSVSSGILAAVGVCGRIKGVAAPTKPAGGPAAGQGPRPTKHGGTI